MSGGWLTKRVVLGSLEGAGSKESTGWEGERVDRQIHYVWRDVRTLGVAGDWEATVLEAEMWVETVTEGGQRRDLWPRGRKKRWTRLDIAKRKERRRD